MKNKSLFRIPQDYKTEMVDFVVACVSSWPEYNITETVSEFAEADRKIGKGLTAEPGPFDFNLTPYLREPADCLSDNSPTLEVYMSKGTQIGYNTGISQNHIGYCVKHGIGPLLFVGAGQSMAEEEMEKRVDEMLFNSGLSHKIRANVQKKKGKATGDRSDSKSYAGTWMRAIGPNSEGRARSFPARIVHFDEMSSYPWQHTKDGSMSGDVVEKIRRRQDTYGTLKKTLGGSTPLLAGSSRIDELVEIGDKCFYNWNCPKCDFQQPFVWTGFHWLKNKDGSLKLEYENVNGVDIPIDPVYYECADCGNKIYDDEKQELLLEKGRGGSAEWVPTKKPDRPFVRSFHVPAFYGRRGWLDIALQWEEVKDDPFKLPDFINNVLGQCWADSEIKPDEHELLQLAQQYEQWNRGTIKNEVLMLSIEADIQADRIEAGLIGYGRNKQVYMVEYWVFPGDTESVENQCYKDLAEKINAKYKREDGREIYVMIAFVDSQYRSDTIDLFCDQFPYNPNSIAGVYPVQAKQTQDLLVKHHKSNIKTPVVGMHDQMLKRALYNVLRKRPTGLNQFPGYFFHFSHQYGPEFYKQLTSEEIVPQKVKGVNKGFLILNTKQRRNEVLDICKMGLAALQYAIDRYFFLKNEERKLQKRNILQEDASMFFDSIEQQLLSGS